jgi:hypothetical protein
MVLSYGNCHVMLCFVVQMSVSYDNSTMLCYVLYLRWQSYNKCHVMLCIVMPMVNLMVVSINFVFRNQLTAACSVRSFSSVPKMSSAPPVAGCV